ncbi:MAG: DUF4252 domain-containing protein [Vicinamibacterales bacterium]
MKTMTRRARSMTKYLGGLWLCAALVVSAPDAQAQALKLDHLSRLAAEATESVDLTLPPELIQLAAGAVAQGDPKQAAVKDLLAGLKGITVKSFKFDRDGVYTQEDVDAVYSQLSGWARIVDLKEIGEAVSIHLLQEAGQTSGLVVVVAEPRELTVVNIVGVIDLAKLGALAGQFGIPELPIPAP